MLNIPSQPATPEAPVESSSAPVEAAPQAPEAPEAEKPTIARDELSSRLEALIRKEKAHVRKQQEYKTKEQQLAEREAKIKEFDSLKEQAQLNPLNVLKSLGLTYDQLTNFVLNGEQPTPQDEISSIRKEMQSFKEQQEQARLKEIEEAKTRQQAEYDKAITDFKESVNQFVVEHADDYELIHLHQGQELVFATIEEHFNKTQKILSTKEASDLVESYLEEQVQKTLETKKFKSKLQPQIEPKPEDKGEPKPTEAPKTLTNQLNSMSTPSLLPAKTENDRMARAMAALTRS